MLLEGCGPARSLYLAERGEESEIAEYPTPRDSAEYPAPQLYFHLGRVMAMQPHHVEYYAIAGARRSVFAQRRNIHGNSWLAQALA